MPSARAAPPPPGRRGDGPVIAGQLAFSVVLDRLGVLGLPERALTWKRVLGIALLALGTVLILRE